MISEIPDWAVTLTAEIVLAYPQIVPDRAVFIRNQLMKLDAIVARQAWTEYLDKSHDELFQIGTFLAVAHRVKCQMLPSPAEKHSEKCREEMEAKRRMDAAMVEARGIVSRMEPGERELFQQEFLSSQKGDFARKLYAGQFARGVLPISFLQVVYEKTTGQKVA